MPLNGPIVEWSHIRNTLRCLERRRRLQREQRELKTPQERAFCDEEAEAVPAESVRRNGKQQFVCTKGPVC